MGKRTNTQAAKQVNKKVKVDPALEVIAGVINEAEHLPQQCRTMLTEILPLSLNVPTDKRHKHQTMAVSMFEETLNTKKAAMEAAVSAANEKLDDLKASEEQLASTVKEAEVAVAAQQEVSEASKERSASAVSAVEASQTALSECIAAQKAGNEQAAADKEQKDALEVAFEKHFKTPMAEGTAGPDFAGLEPFLKTIDIEASLLTALPSTCTKPKDQRGAFDEVVLQELEKAISAKLAALAQLVEAEIPTAAEREAAVRAAEQENEAKKEASSAAAAELETAQKELSERQAALSKAKLAVDEFRPTLLTLAGSVDTLRKALSDFESGPLASFMSYKVKSSMPVDVATAGA